MAKTANKSEEVLENTESVVEKAEVAPKAETVVETPAEEVAKSEEVIVTDNVEVAHTPAEEVAKADEPASTEPVAEAATEVSKSDDSIVESIADIKNTITSAFSDLTATVKSLQAEVEMLKASKVDVNVAKDSFEAVAKDIASAREEFDKFGKRVDAVEADTAFRKSGDLGEIIQEQPVMAEKSLWGGSFLKTADLFR